MPLDDKKQDDVKIPTKEELLALENEGDVEEGVQEGDQEPQYTDTELKAIDQGWKPKDKWEGNPEDHRSAREYLDRGELLGKIKSQNVQLGEIKQALQGMTEHNRRVFAAGYEKALVDLKAQKVMAIREGDADTVVALDDKIDETKEALRTINNPKTPARQEGPSPVTQRWMSENPWYRKDRVMTNHVHGIAQEIGRSMPGISEEDLYEMIDEEVRKDFPDFFKKKGPQGAPSPDGDSRRSVGAGKPSGNANATFDKILSGMSEMEATIARNMVKHGGISKEDYVKDYNKIGGR